jgi:hypothetical protein
LDAGTAGRALVPADELGRYASQDAAVSFDVFLRRFVNGESAEVDRRPVREVLSTATYRGPDDLGFYVVAFPDGVEVEFSAATTRLRTTAELVQFAIRNGIISV